MVVAYVMVKAHTGGADRLKRDIGAIEGVVRGVHRRRRRRPHHQSRRRDPGAVRDVAATQIQGIDGIEDTQTYIAMDLETKLYGVGYPRRPSAGCGHHSL